jgi:GNAT superfamily N-acetyltransferase
VGGITVRAARAGDLETLLGFQQAMALETEGKSLDPARVRAGLAAVLADPARGRYLVAERDGEALGCLMLTLEWSDWRNGWFWWIQSVYTRGDARGAGVFRALYDHVLAEARARPDVCGVRLYVERENAAAQRVYERVGMRPSAYRFYEVDFVLGGGDVAR